MQRTSNISKTGYRILTILRLLFEKPCSKAEINEYFINNSITAKPLSDDTITLYINVLRKNNISIARPHKSNGYKYSLTIGPGLLCLETKDINFLNKLKSFYAENGEWLKIFDLNELAQKILPFITPDKQELFIEKVIKSKPFSFQDNHKINELNKYCLNKTPIRTTYNSPNSGKKSYDIMPEDICLENHKLYLWCTNINNFQTHYLRIDRIKYFEKLDIQVNTIQKDIPTIKYLLTGQEAILFEPNSKYDKILLKNENEILVETQIINEFWLLQKIMSYGKDCVVIEPEEYRQKIKNKLKDMIIQYV